MNMEHSLRYMFLIPRQAIKNISLVGQNFDVYSMHCQIALN